MLIAMLNLTTKTKPYLTSLREEQEELKVIRNYKTHILSRTSIAKSSSLNKNKAIWKVFHVALMISKCKRRKTQLLLLEQCFIYFIRANNVTDLQQSSGYELQEK